MATRYDLSYPNLLRSIPVPELRVFWGAIPLTSLPMKKQLISLCRSRRIPEHSTVLYRLCKDAIDFLHNLPSAGDTRMSSETMLDWLRCHATPTVWGWTLSMILSSPMDKDVIEDIKLQMVLKELCVTESTPRIPVINWDGLWDGSFFLYPTAPRVLHYIWYRIHQWKETLQTTVLYPKMGSKLVPRSSTQDLHGYSLDYCFEEASTRDLEVIYSRTGQMVEGPCEMKQRWYPTGIVPRTYFAQGGSAYHSSKYLQGPLNDLCDSIRPTMRHKRTLPHLVHIEEGERFRIYDLTTFTSNFHEHNSFLQSLVRFTADLEVRIFDGYHGELVVHFGDILQDYLCTCNLQPEFSLESIGYEVILRHSVAGFLGVYGNLVSCTYPHGAFLSTVVQGPEKCYVAGDDAGFSHSDPDWVEDHVELLGLLAREKCFNADEDGAIALKRPIEVRGGSVFHHVNVICPTFGVLFGDERFRKEDRETQKVKFARALIPFLNSCRNFELSVMDRELSLKILRRVYHHLELPPTGYLPQVVRRPKFHCAVPIIDEECFHWDPLVRLADMFYPGYYMVPMVDEDVGEDIPIFSGDKTISVMSRKVRYLVGICYLRMSMRRTLLLGEEGLQGLMSEVTGWYKRQHAGRIIYDLECVENIPSPLLR